MISEPLTVCISEWWSNKRDKEEHGKIKSRLLEDERKATNRM